MTEKLYALSRNLFTSYFFYVILHMTNLFHTKERIVMRKQVLIVCLIGVVLSSAVSCSQTQKVPDVDTEIQTETVLETESPCNPVLPYLYRKSYPLRARISPFFPLAQGVALAIIRQAICGQRVKAGRLSMTQCTSEMPRLNSYATSVSKP